MTALALSFVLAATGGAATRVARTSFRGAAIDGRAVVPGGLFFALRGQHHDGHAFVGQAVAGGAAGLIVERGRTGALAGAAATTVIEVDDPVQALGALGRAHRERLAGLRVIGVTGSNGKTTTKELLAAILVAHAGEAAVLKTSGNFNNHLGLPLTLLRLHEGHRFAVIEMGMSARGEIAALARLARPEIGVVVNVGPVHLETLGSLDEVARAKGELLAALPARGTAIVPDGDARLLGEALASPAVRRLRFGARPGVEVRIESVSPGEAGTLVGLRLPAGEHLVARLSLLGAHNAANAAAAAAAACALGVAAPEIERGLSLARAEKHRTSLSLAGGRRILDDCYNASPPSMLAALDTLVALAGSGRSIAVLGDMLELGADELALHRRIGERAAELGLHLLVTVGERARSTAAAARHAGMVAGRVRACDSTDEAADLAAAAAAPGDLVLVKASRGMRLERVVARLQERFAATQQEGGVA